MNNTNTDFQTLINNYIKEQEEKLNQKRKDAMLLIFKNFVEEELGYKIYLEETVGRREAKLCFEDTTEFHQPGNYHEIFKYDLDTCEQIFE